MISQSEFPLTTLKTQKALNLLGSEFAVMGGAMSWISERNLVSAISECGGFGVLACGAMTPDLLDQEIAATKEKTQKPFGVNLIVMHPDLDALVETCARHQVSHVVLAGGLPSKRTVSQLHDGGIKVLAFAPALPLARKFIRMGVDGLIFEGAEAGGHIGPVATSVLAQELLPHIDDISVFAAGGIGHGEAMAAYLAMGASGIQMGTRFVCATECIAHTDFKKAFIKASARDAVPSTQVDPEFKVIPVRALKNNATKAFTQTQIDTIAKYRKGEISQKDAALTIEHFWAGALRKAVIDGNIDEGSLMAGQSVGMVEREEPVEIIMRSLLESCEAALSRQFTAP